MGRSGLTLGLGPSHAPVVEGVLGLSYENPGRHTEEYLRIIAALLRTGDADVDGADWSVHSGGRMAESDHPIPILLSALSPRMLGIAGRFADGVVLWMASAAAIGTSIVTLLQTAAVEAGRPGPRVVAGLPVAVHDDLGQARDAVNATAVGYAGMRNFKRIIDAGGGASPADVAILGAESTVRRRIADLSAVGVTDVWAQPVAVGDDRLQRRESLHRTRTLLGELAREHSDHSQAATVSSPARVVRCSRRTEEGSNGSARCSIPVLSHITRSPVRHWCRIVNSGRVDHASSRSSSSRLLSAGQPTTSVAVEPSNIDLRPSRCVQTSG